MIRGEINIVRECGNIERVVSSVLTEGGFCRRCEDKEEKERR